MANMRFRKMIDNEIRTPNHEVKGYVLRRSPRAMVKLPIVIRGIDKHGYEFEEETETFMVSKYGARIFTVHELEENAVLKLRLKNSEDWTDFRIAWVGSEEAKSGGHIGIEFIQTTNFFGVLFPHEDWGASAPA
jgi:hypothetical protein